MYQQDTFHELAMRVFVCVAASCVAFSLRVLVCLSVCLSVVVSARHISRFVSLFPECDPLQDFAWTFVSDSARGK